MALTMANPMKRISRRRFVKLGGATAALAVSNGVLGGRRGRGRRHHHRSRSFGCNTAWHLHERGRKVLVLEAEDRPATQASHAGAGFVARCSGVHVPSWGRTEWEMQAYGINFYTWLARDCGFDIGFAPCGACYIYPTAQGWELVQARAARARSYGTQS
jgi:hypothetical protein